MAQDETLRPNLTLKGPPVSIIAALRESPDSILIATDSEQTESDGRDPVRSLTDRKLQWHPTLPLAWGTKDNFTIGGRFSDWLKQFDWPSADWYSVQQQIGGYLSLLNGHQRHLSRTAGIDPLPTELCGVLVVGFLEGIGSIFEVDARGSLTVKDHHEFHAIGSGWVHAQVAFETLNRVRSNVSSEEKLKTIVSIAADMGPACGPPVNLARVTSSGVTLLSQ